MPPRRKNKRLRRHKRNRFGVKSANRKLKGSSLKAVLIIAAIAIAAVLWRYMSEFFITSSLFNVSRIELTMRPFLKEALRLDFYNIPPGSNIFRLNIDAAGIGTQKRHPEFKSVVISRKPPNVMSVKIEYKQPVAFVEAGPQRKIFYDKREISCQQKGGFALIPISGEGIILPPDIAAGKALPILSGVDFSTPLIKVGSVCTDKKLPVGIKFLAAAQSHWGIKSHRIDKVDLSDTKDISIFLENGIDVKMGPAEGMQGKLMSLKNVLEEPRFDLAKIKYIDLRFSDVVIGPGEAISNQKGVKLTGK